MDSDLSEPHRKRCHLKSVPPLPLRTDGKPVKYTGIFNGFCVTVNDEDSMKALVSMGYFGKANLSRTYPQFDKVEIIRQRVWKNRKLFRGSGPPRKIVVVPDSSDEEEVEINIGGVVNDGGISKEDNKEKDLSGYFTNLKPRYELDYSGIHESVHLGLEEAFFLSSALGVLQIDYEDRKKLSSEEIWGLFIETDRYFPQNYVVYYHFRAKNWVVRSGNKFGGDFLLYKQGPPFYHASYVIIIENFDEKQRRLVDKNRHNTDVEAVMGLNRLCESSAKDLIICQVIWPSDIAEDTTIPFDLTKIGIKEILVKRWVPSQERNASTSAS